MKIKKATLELTFFEDGEESMNLQTNDIPKTLVLEQINALSKFLAKQIVEDAQEVVDDKNLEAYLDARIKVDRKNLKDLFK